MLAVDSSKVRVCQNLPGEAKLEVCGRRRASRLPQTESVKYILALLIIVKIKEILIVQCFNEHMYYNSVYIYKPNCCI